MKLKLLAVSFLLPIFSQADIKFAPTSPNAESIKFTESKTTETVKITKEVIVPQKTAKAKVIKLDGIEEQVKSKSLEAAKLSTNSKYRNFNQNGSASWYGDKFHGRKTANGERYNMHAMTAAHRTLPLGSTVKVTNTANGKSVIVRINDRGPYHSNRVIDLSRAAAQELGFLHKGVAKVNITTVK